MFLTSKECAWQHASVKFLTRTITGIRGWEVKKTHEKEHLYAAGSDPIDIQEGNRAYSGSLKLLGFEIDMLNQAAQIAGYLDATEVPHEEVILTISFKKRIQDSTTTIQVYGVAIQEIGAAMEQNAKNRETTVPYIAMGAAFV